jgi:hypothetical protein
MRKPSMKCWERLDMGSIPGGATPFAAVPPALVKPVVTRDSGLGLSHHGPLGLLSIAVLYRRLGRFDGKKSGETLLDFRSYASGSTLRNLLD